MKLDEDVKMISAEAPLLFAKAAEIFIHELTLRAWVHTENNKRRTLQRNDIAMAITKFDQFDFLIDIVPREEIKPVRKESPTKPLVNCDQVQYYLQLAQQHQQALQGTGTTTNMASTTSIPTTIQLQGQPVTPVTLNTGAAPQNLLVTNTGQPISSVTGTVVNGLGNLQTTAQPQQQIQIVQQIVGPSGEIQHVPVTFILSFGYITFQIINISNRIGSLTDKYTTKPNEFNSNAGSKSGKSTTHHHISWFNATANFTNGTKCGSWRCISKST